MKETIKLIVVLTVICSVAGLMLAAVNKVTKTPISAAARTEKLNAMKKVLPEFNNEPDKDVHILSANDKPWEFYIARKDGKFTGAAFVVSSDKGYGGKISVMVGVDSYEELHAIAILKQLETTGLGAKIEELEFRNAFPGRSLSETKWAVKKDGGDIDQITAATISSRAVVDAIAEGVKVYLANIKEIQNSKTETDKKEKKDLIIELDDKELEDIDEIL